MSAPLLLSDEDIRQVLTIDDCLSALEDAIKQEALGAAKNTSSSATYFQSQSDACCEFVSMEGALRSPAVFALRVRAGNRNRPGSNLLLLFSGVTGELLALLRHGLISAYRVGATSGLAARAMSRHNARIVGIIGSGRLARAHALAYAAVRKIELFKVYSPDSDHRKAFADWVKAETHIRAEAFDNPEPVVRGSDIVATCTDSTVPVLRAEWLEQRGLHLAGVQLVDGLEVEPEGLKYFQRVVTYISGLPSEFDLDNQPNGTRDQSAAILPMLSTIPERCSLPELLVGAASGRQSEDESNYFLSQGTGVQFAAVAALMYQKACERGIGRQLPAEMVDYFHPRRHSF
jgi:ornithine cyclodeaminase/alanine dehydrogenase-like protein (mu-crystallin family)